jgi:hypothetical protein
MRRSLREMPVALMMVKLVVRTPESIVSFGFYAFWAYFHNFLHVYKCNFNILVCKHLDIMYASIEQFYWMLNEACGRSNNREN